MLKHKKTSAIPDGGDTSLVQPSDWNDDHQVSGGFDLPLENVSAPPANTVRLFGGKLGGRMMPAAEGQDGSVSFMQPSLALKRVAMFIPAGNSTTITNIGLVTATAGTATAANVALTSVHTESRRIDYLATTAATTAVAQVVTANFQWCRSVGFFVAIRVGGATGMTTATHRFFMGATSTGSITDQEPSARSDLIGVGYDSADANFQLMHRTGSGAVTKVDLGASFPRQTVDRSKMYDFHLYSPPNGSSVFYQLTDLETGAVASGEITTNLPASTTLLRFLSAASVGGTSSVIGISIAQIYIETDY